MAYTSDFFSANCDFQLQFVAQSYHVFAHQTSIWISKIKIIMTSIFSHSTELL